MNDGRRTDDAGPWVYYKLTYELLFGSGELKKSCSIQLSVKLILLINPEIAKINGVDGVSDTNLALLPQEMAAGLEISDLDELSV